ncbi:MAG TPA: hypothetical protein VGS19_26935 [Streptosporangiaceae bacterium]|nr:hypothetical protein [Streptosporangiaceae bacterium]
MAGRGRPANECLRALIAEAGVSHKGLARRVVDLGKARGVVGLCYDHSSVGRWLGGEQPREPVPELIAEVFTGLLARPVGVAEVGMTESRVPVDVGLVLAETWDECVAAAVTLGRADVQRRRFLQDSAVTVSASSAVALRWLVTPACGPPQRTGRRQVGESEVTAIGEVVRSYRELDNRLGGGRVRAPVIDYLNAEVVPLLTDGSYSAATGAKLAAAAAELAQLAGWMAYDSGLHGHAQRYLTLALSFARHAGDDGLGSEVLAAKAHQAVWLARPAEAVDLARAAQASARRAGLGTLLTECHVMEAHGHAARNDAHACAKALTQAEAAFDSAAREGDPGWLAYFDEAYLAARMAHCFHALGEPAHAERYARRSLDMDGRFVRGKAFNLSLLATALADQDQVEQACAVGTQALHLTGRLRSARANRYVRDLQRALRPRASEAVVREFNQRAAQCLPAAAVPAARQ